MALVVVGAIGAAVSIADFAGWDVLLLSAAKDPLSLVLLTVGLLSLALGLERVVRFRRQEQQFEQIRHVISKLSGGQHLRGEREVYGSTTRLCNSVQTQIRAIAFTTHPRAPDDWIETIARRLRETKRCGTPARFDVVLASDLDQVPSHLYAGMEKRIKTYKKLGVSDLISYKLLDVKWPIGFDVVIWDRDHVKIAFPMLSGVEQVQRAVLFENQPDIASEFASWFD